MEIIKLNIKGHYFYCPDIQIDNYDKHLNKQKLLSECAICKRSILEASYETITNNRYIVLENEITIGKCGHMYHSDCINSWLKTNNICPIDKVGWQTLRIADTTTKLTLNEDKNHMNNIKDNKFNKHNFDYKKYDKKVQPIKQMAKQNSHYPEEQHIHHEENVNNIPLNINTVASNWNTSPNQMGWGNLHGGWGNDNSAWEMQ